MLLEIGFKIVIVAENFNVKLKDRLHVVHCSKRIRI